MKFTSQLGTSATILAAMLATGCASNDPQLVTDSTSRSPCPGDMTPLCIEYVGKRLRCYCSTKDGLKEILDPDNQ